MAKVVEVVLRRELAFLELDLFEELPAAVELEIIVNFFWFSQKQFSKSIFDAQKQIFVDELELVEVVRF